MSNTFEYIIMLEAIALAVIGGSAYIMLKHIEQDVGDLQPTRYLSLAVIAGIIVFALFGEPTNVTAWQFMAAGFAAPTFVKEILVPWWKA